jgi:DNA end-binding protein Ku
LPEDPESGAATRAFWSGTLTFGLVSVPVDLFPAVRTERVSLRMLAPDGTPLSRRYFCPQEEREIGYDEIVRGYELDGRFVTVTDEELEALAPRKSRDIDLRLFVDRAEIDPMHFERSYSLAPGGDSTKAYRLLAATMERTGRAGIATFVMRTREYLIAIIAENGLLRAETLRFEDEVRSPEDVDLPQPEPADDKAAAAFEKRIRELEQDELDAAELVDRDAERLRARIEEKRRSGRDVIEGEVTDTAAEEEDDVIDLMEILKRRMRARAKDEQPTRRASRGAAADLDSLTKKELYERARQLDIEGRSGMSKDELIRAIRLSA